MEINVRKKVYGFFLDRDANLYECAYLNNRNKLCTSTGERLKDKTRLVEKSAAKMPDADMSFVIKVIRGVVSIFSPVCPSHWPA